MKQITLRKITSDNSAKYIPKNEQAKERDFKLDTKKSNSLTRKQLISEIFQKTIKKNCKNFAAKGFAVLR